jgi:hypothetical protein
MSLFKKDKKERKKIYFDKNLQNEIDEMKKKFDSKRKYKEIIERIKPLLESSGSLDKLKVFYLQLKELNQQLINKNFKTVGVNETMKKVEDNIRILEKVYQETGRKIILWDKKEYELEEESDKTPYFKFIYLDDRDFKIENKL